VFERVGSQVRSPISRPQSDLCRLVSPGCPDPKTRESLNSHPPGYLDLPGNLAPSTYSSDFCGMGMPVGFCGDWSSGRGVTSSRCRPCPFFFPQTAQVPSQEYPSHVLELADFHSPMPPTPPVDPGAALINRTESCRGEDCPIPSALAPYADKVFTRRALSANMTRHRRVGCLRGTPSKRTLFCLLSAGLFRRRTCA
jgi:hypothetical protein